ncbi:MAG: hypothetical protein V1773_15440 [bacterium]
MIFIYENQHIESSKLINITAVKAFTYKEACTIYKSLDQLTDNLLNDVHEIAFLLEKLEIDESSILAIFRNFSADPEDYPNENQLMNEIWGFFPNPIKLQNEKRRKKIETLINEMSIIFYENDKTLNSLSQSPKSFFFFCPLIKKASHILIESLHDNKVLIQIENYTAKLKAEVGSYSISKGKYLQIYNELVKIRENYNENLPEKPWKLREYRPVNPLKYFENSLYYKIISTSNTKLHFYGHDTFLTSRATEQILFGKDRIYYSMPKDLKAIQSENKSAVIQNFDSINDPIGYHELHERVKETEDKSHVILQAIRNVHSKYFYYYDNIEIPQGNEIRKHLTGIFISLLRDRNIFQGDDYWRLYPLVEKNLLEKVIPQIDDIEILYNCINDFSKIEHKDLMNNIQFWYLLEERIKYETEMRKKQDNTPPPQKVVFEKVDNEWIISGLGKTFTIQGKRNMGFLFLLIIINAKREIDSTDIVNSSIKFQGKANRQKNRDKRIDDVNRKYTDSDNRTKESIKAKEELLGSDRSIVSSAISVFNKNLDLRKHGEFIHFIKHNISSTGCSFFFDPKGEYSVTFIPQDLFNKD